MHGREIHSKDTRRFISLVHCGDVCTQPMDRQVYRKALVRLQVWPSLSFSSLLYPSSVCGSKATCLSPCFLLSLLIHFSLFLPTSFRFFQYERGETRLYIVYRTYITPWDPGPTRRGSRREEGGAGRSGRRERMKLQGRNQPPLY